MVRPSVHLIPDSGLFSNGYNPFFYQVAASSLSSLARFPWGSKSLSGNASKLESRTNPLHLQLYEFGDFLLLYLIKIMVVL